MRAPTLSDIQEAHARISSFIHRTPLLTSKSINDITGSNLFFKCENLQKGGAFKFRGATNAVRSLSAAELEKGVATHSSGNHAAALSLAARMSGSAAHIVMPRTAPKIKIKAVEEYGGIITFCEPTLASREETLDKIVARTGAVFIHPYNNYSVIAGQATCAKEIIEELGDTDYIVVPVGGGGLTSGSALSAKYFGSGVEVIGAEPTGADDAFRSLRDGYIHPSVSPKTVADGLLTSLGDKTFPIIKENVSEILTVKEESIITAMRMIWERMKIIVEPSAAVTLAAVLENKDKFSRRKTALIISGGNVDLTNLPWK